MKSPPNDVMTIRFLSAMVLLLTLVACGPQGSSADRAAERDAADYPEYAQAVEKLVEINRKAAEAIGKGDRATAAALVKEGQPLSKEVLRAHRPSRKVMEAVSDLDHVYATLLLDNGHVVWARQLFTTNAARWKHAQPETEDTKRRLDEANAGVTRCDQALAKQASQPAKR